MINYVNKIKPKLSIIIPCFNCEKTIAEAVSSLYKQNLDNFEIIIIDDKSTDKTYEEIIKISKEFTEIRYFQNKENLGGGATRNLAVEKCLSDYVFCLDSDDILGENSLSKMLDYIIKNNFDAVGVKKSIKFKNRNINDICYVSNFLYENQTIPKISLFENDTCSLYSVFMFKKDSFTKVGGYPDNHGFDTQGLAFRFLINNLKCSTCPETTYYHRINFHKSYYTREYESGKINHNWYKIFEEFLYIFTPETQDIILNFDLNNPNKILFNEIKKIITPENINGLNENLYWTAWKKFNNKNYREAQNLFEKFIENNSKNEYSHYYLSLCVEKTKIPSNFIDNKKIKHLFSYKKQGAQLSIFVRIFRKILRMIYDKKN